MPKFQTDADHALDVAVDRLAANRLTVEQVLELAKIHGRSERAVGRVSDLDTRHARTLAWNDLERAIRANHRDTKGDAR